MKKYLFLLSASFFVGWLSAQELYPYTEPASNMPSRSVSLKFSSMLGKKEATNGLGQRHTPEVMFGLNKKWMLHAATTFSDMHQRTFMWESARLYAKWRFLSVDEVHKHFRLATFATATYSRNHLNRNEINLMSDQSGVQAGLIATQLWNKFALSATGSWNEVLNSERWDDAHENHYAFRALNYSLSAGYLLLPRQYTDYNQTNLNLYVELLGSRNLNFPHEKYYVDLAPSVQLIFNSSTKLNVGYRFQLAGDIHRIMNRSFMVSVEHIFLDALRKQRF